MNDIIKQASSMFMKNYSHILIKNGVLPPSKNKDPVNPPLVLKEYEGMEKDTSKYILYYAAIYAQLQKKYLQTTDDKMKLMIVGGGMGRLVDYCIDCCQELNINFIIYVIECNANANEFLQDRYKAAKFVVVFPPFVVRTEEELLLAIEFGLCSKELKELAELRPIDLFVSELFGSFGDNECVSEILSTCKKMFGKINCTSIPCAYTTYLTAVYSPSLESYFEKSDCYNLHILGLPSDAVFLTKLTKAYEQSCTEGRYSIDVIVELEQLHTYDNFSLTGFAGYFRADLGHDIIIDTTPSESRNTFFWETAFFPLAKSKCQLEFCKSKYIPINFTRNVDIIKPNLQNIFNIKQSLVKVLYSWAVLNDDFTVRANQQSNHVVCL